MTQAQKEWARSIPRWIYFVYGVAVTTGVAGSIGLFLRKSWTIATFAICLAAVTVQGLHHAHRRRATPPPRNGDPIRDRLDMHTHYPVVSLRSTTGEVSFYGSFYFNQADSQIRNTTISGVVLRYWVVKRCPRCNEVISTTAP